MSRDAVFVRIAPTVLRASPAMICHQGHRGTIHSTFDTMVNQSGQVAWPGGSATAHEIKSLVGEADVMATAVELHFSWNSGYINAEARSGGKIWYDENRPSYAYILPPGTLVAFRMKKAREFRNLSVELERDFLLGAAGFEGPVNFDISETWDYRDPLSWQLARVVYDECTNGPPQGILYTETAAPPFAIHLLRNTSTVTPLRKESRRGGLPPSRLPRAGDYIMSRLGEDIS